MAMYGYARCSTVEQNTDDQIKRLYAAGCDHVYADVGVSGKLASRPEWDKCLKRLSEGDTLVVTKLDRPGRSVQHLIELSNDLRVRGVGFKVLDQPIDTTTPAGRLFFTIMAAVAEFERELIIERTHEGLRTARANGKKSGRKFKLSEKQRATIRELHDNGKGKGVTELATVFGVSRPVIYRALSEGKVSA